MTVGVFDSGIGGLTVTKSLLDSQLFSRIIYFGDTARVPYGTKDKNTIIRYSLEALEFFKNFPIDMLIVACNTASAHAIPELREVADCEVVGVIEPGVAALSCHEISKESEVLVIGTKATVSSGRYEQLLQAEGYTQVRSRATGLFVPIVEEGLFGGPILEQTIQHYLGGLPEPAAMILGCTHFPLIADSLQRFFPRSLIVHSGEAIVEHLKNHHHLNAAHPQAMLELFASENPGFLKSVAAQWL